MDLSVIIVNYNVRQFLENALVSIKRSLAGIESEIIVVDNDSDDGSVEMMREKFPDVDLVASDINMGFARANNVALKRATGKFLLLINPDTIVQEDTCRVMLDFLIAHPDVGLAGCKILNPDGTFQLACRRSFPTPWVALTKISGMSSLFPGSRMFGKYNLTYLNPDELYEVDALSGSFMMMARVAYEAVGDLDESFFMYGEDLDWCYRTIQAGFKVYYVPATTIIHFKGESTRRSNIDEIRVFYRAMQLFVEKHFSRSVVVEMLLTLGIVLRAALAFVARAGQSILLAALDYVLVVLSFTAAEFLYFGGILRFPERAYPAIWIAPPLLVVSVLYGLGLYGNARNSVSRAGTGVLISYLIISATVFFAKDFAFSRAVVLISGALSLVFLPGWRFGLRVFSPVRGTNGSRRSLFGRKTLIVGSGESGQEVLRRLRARVDGGYDVQGFIDVDRRRVGQHVAGVEILGSLENISKVIAEEKIAEVIFSTNGLSYVDMLSTIARSNARGVNFRLVPDSLDAIVGKTRIDPLDTIPLVDIEYNIQKPVHRILKRLLDLLVGVIAVVFVYPVALLRSGNNPHSRWGHLLRLPRVVGGSMSLVGRPYSDDETGETDDYLGKKGITGLVQINRRDDMQTDEIEAYELYYARNQSLMLDIEILLKSLLLFMQTPKE